jgi:predicted dehydrogenase
MWAAFVDELSGSTATFGCATPEEALLSHRLFTAALKSHDEGVIARV